VLALLLYISLVLHHYRRHSSTASDGGEKPFPTLLGTIPSVAQLLVWLWIAAQGSSTLFQQAQGIAPPALTSLYASLAALQFQGVTLDPACYSSTPFLTFWVAIGFILLCIVLGSLSLWALRRAREKKGELPPNFFLHTLPTVTLSAVTLAPLLGYGAITSVFSSALTCNPPTLTPLLNYVTLVSDGRSVRTALGPAFPSLATLQAAAANPYLPSNTQVYRLMASTYIPVSTLAANPFQVCAEGPHWVVWWVAMAFTVLFTLGLPLLGMCTLGHVGMLKGARRLGGRIKSKLFSSSLPPPQIATAKGGAAVSITSPTPPPTHTATILGLLHSKLTDPALRNPTAWYPYWDQLLLTIYTGLVALSQRSSSVGGYALIQGGLILTSLTAITLLVFVQPFVPSHAWKRLSTGAIHGLTATTALMNTLAVYKVGGGGEGGITLGIIPLVCALAVGLFIVGAWWFNGFRFGITTGGWWREGWGLPSTAPTAPTLHDSSTLSSSSSSPWEFITDEDGDTFWYNPSLKLSAWDLPPGATAVDKAAQRATTEGKDIMASTITPSITLPLPSSSSIFPVESSPPGTPFFEGRSRAEVGVGWEVEGVEGGERIWVHRESGVRSAQPPPVDKKEAEAFLLAHFVEQVKVAWRVPFGGGQKDAAHESNTQQWERIEDGGEVWFINKDTGESVWEIPMS